MSKYYDTSEKLSIYQRFKGWKREKKIFSGGPWIEKRPGKVTRKERRKNYDNNSVEVLSIYWLAAYYSRLYNIFKYIYRRALSLYAFGRSEGRPRKEYNTITAVII